MTLLKVATHLCLLITGAVALQAQNAAPTSGDVTVRLSEPIDFAAARPLQAVRSIVVNSSNPAIPTGSLAVLQLQNRDGSFTLKLLRISAGGMPLKTMSQPGVSVSGGPASGQHASLPDGAVVRFTLTQQDGTPGTTVLHASTPTPPAASAVAATSPSKAGTTKDRAHFEIEGVKLGQSVAEVLAAEKAYSPKVSKQQGLTSISFKTADLNFVIGFSNTGAVNRMDIYSITKTKGDNALSDLKKAAVTSPMYKKAVQVFGAPDDTSAGDEATWKNADGSTAGYSLDGDTVEVLAKQ